MENQRWNEKTIEETAEAIKVNLSTGLSRSEVEERKKRYGLNKIEGRERSTWLQMLLSQFKDVLVLILLAAAVISGILGEIADAVIIFVVILVNAIMGTVQESKAEKSLEALKNLSAPNAKVKRDGSIQVVSAQELVPGDIVYFEAGDFIPADSRIIEAVNLKVEESSLTGESVPVEKKEGIIEGDVPLGDRTNMVFSSTIVTYGRGSAVVTATGMNTEVGKIASMLDQDDDRTPLQEKLAETGKWLGIGAIIICIVIFALGVFQGRDIFEMFFIAVSLAVAAIPEGLPAVVTIVLAMGVRRLVKRNAIIRKLPAVETLGSASVICSDKTGTLTQNRMTVQQVVSLQGTWDKEAQNVEESELGTILEIGALCNDSRLEKTDTGWRGIGDPTETALTTAAADYGIVKHDVESQKPRVAEIPFDSDRKLMTTVHKLEDRFRIMVKGAPDILLSKCTHILKGKEVVQAGEQDIREIESKNTGMAEKAFRVLAVAFRDVENIPELLVPDTVEKELCFAGLIGMIDPPRDEAREAVNLCLKAGIRPVMITGDHKATAAAIAKELGILKGEEGVITGAELSRLSDEEFSRDVEKYSVYARVSPEHKVRIVDAWQDKGHIVAMTGDGVNDAPALKKANIGAAMGITGTDVAKEAADMVLTDDNFATVVSAVREGRGIFDNLRKAIQYLLATNLAEILLLFTAILLNWDSPLLAIHILWVNLVTDSFPALALGVEPIGRDVMNRPPRKAGKSIFADGLGYLIILQGMMIAIITLAVFVYGRTFGIDTARTMTFFTLSFCQLVQAFNVRSPRSLIADVGLFTNKYLLYAVGVSGLLQVIIIGTPFLREVFKLVLLDLNQWIIVAAASILPFIIVETVKLILRFRYAGRVRFQ